jgi:hypothetical protein
MSVAIEAVFLRLTSAYAALRDALQSLALTVIEDRPPHDEVLLVERLGNLVEDLRGWTEEGYRAAVEARKAIDHPPDLHRVRRALGQGNERLIVVEYRFFGEAVAHDTIDALLRFGRQRGREWLGWSKSVVEALDACRMPLRALDEALLQTWQELGERLATRSVSLQTTNIGQQISASRGPRAGSQGKSSRLKDELT